MKKMHMEKRDKMDKMEKMKKGLKSALPKRRDVKKGEPGKMKMVDGKSHFKRASNARTPRKA